MFLQLSHDGNDLLDQEIVKMVPGGNIKIIDEDHSIYWNDVCPCYIEQIIAIIRKYPNITFRSVVCHDYRIERISIISVYKNSKCVSSKTVHVHNMFDLEFKQIGSREDVSIADEKEISEINKKYFE
jgi:hypothetical protein